MPFILVIIRQQLNFIVSVNPIGEGSAKAVVFIFSVGVFPAPVFHFVIILALVVVVICLNKPMIAAGTHVVICPVSAKTSGRQLYLRVKMRGNLNHIVQMNGSASGSRTIQSASASSVGSNMV